MCHLRELHDLSSVLQVRILIPSGLAFSCNNVGYSDVHNIHPIHPFLERRIKPPSRSYSRPEGLDGDGAYDNVDELCEW